MSKLRISHKSARICGIKVATRSCVLDNSYPDTMDVTAMALEKELATYQRKLPELKVSEGKFALVHDTELIDVYTSYEDAIKEGYNKFGLKPFLVKQIHATEQAQFISRIFAPVSA